MFVVVVYIMQVWCCKLWSDGHWCLGPATWPPTLWWDHHCSTAPCPRPRQRWWWWQIRRIAQCCIRSWAGQARLFKGFMGDLQPRIIPWSTTPSTPLLSAFINIDIASYLKTLNSHPLTVFPPNSHFSTHQQFPSSKKPVCWQFPWLLPGCWWHLLAV